LRFSEESSKIIANYPKKFLWPELLEFFQGKTDKLIDEFILILSKLEIITDPGKQMISLVDMFS